MFVCIIFCSTGLQNTLNSWRSVAGADVMTEKQVGFTIILFLDPTSCRNHSKSMVWVVGTKLPGGEACNKQVFKLKSECSVIALYVLGSHIGNP